MEESTSKEKVLKRIRNALISKPANPYPKVDFEEPLYDLDPEAMDVSFAQEFTNLGGKFVYCESEHELLDKFQLLMSDIKSSKVFCREKQITDLLDHLEVTYISDVNRLTETTVGITGCEFLVARLGSILVSSRQLAGRRAFVYPDTHIVFAYASQLVPDVKDALAQLKIRYSGKQFPSSVTLVTGPSRTADIEKTLVMGAHGPRNLYLFYIDDKI